MLPLCAGLLLSTFGGFSAAAADTYQVTGPILNLTASTITVQKNDEKWEIARDPNAKGDATLKVGDRVTIHYRMVATKVELNSGRPTGEAKPAGNPDPATSTKAKKNATR